MTQTAGLWREAFKPLDRQSVAAARRVLIKRFVRATGVDDRVALCVIFPREWVDDHVATCDKV